MKDLRDMGFRQAGEKDDCQEAGAHLRDEGRGGVV